MIYHIFIIQIMIIIDQSNNIHIFIKNYPSLKWIFKFLNCNYRIMFQNQEYTNIPQNLSKFYGTKNTMNDHLAATYKQEIKRRSTEKQWSTQVLKIGIDYQVLAFKRFHVFNQPISLSSSAERSWHTSVFF